MKQNIVALDAQFHATLWQMTEHQVLIATVADLRSRISRFLTETTEALPDQAIDAHIQFHQQLLDVIQTGDVAAAQDEMANHILIAKQRIANHFDYLAHDHNSPLLLRQFGNDSNEPTL